MKLLKFFVVLVLMFFSFVPLTVSSIYLFTFNKQALIDFLQKIPIGRFWLFAVPLIIICYGITIHLFRLLFGIEHDKVKVPEKQVFYLEDDNLGEQLQNVITNRPEISLNSEYEQN